MANPAPSARFDFGRVIERTFKAVGQNLVVFLLLSALLTGIPAAVAGWLTMNYALAMRGLATGAGGAIASTVGTGVGMISLATIVNAIAAAILEAAIVYGTVAFLNGRRADFGECVSVGLRYWFWLILLAIVAGLGEIVGLILFIVPGVMIALAWIVAVPALVVERKGVFGSLGRSADLTRNHRWAILGLVVIYAIATAIIQQAVSIPIMAGMALNPLSRQFLLSQIAVTTLARVVFGVISAAGIASIYYELRSAKEGIGPEALASVFD